MKHGGCYDCKSTTQAILVSVTNPMRYDKGQPDSLAVCDACLGARVAAGAAVLKGGAS